jgi:hypothetical protein
MCFQTKIHLTSIDVYKPTSNEVGIGAKRGAALGLVVELLHSSVFVEAVVGAFGRACAEVF